MNGKTLLALSGILLATTACAAEEAKACTASDCISELTLQTALAEPVTPHVYEFDLTIDGVAQTCRVELTEESLKLFQPAAASCSQTGTFIGLLWADPVTYCSDDDCITVDGIPPSIAITVEATPKAVSVAATRDGDEVLATQTLEPKYQEYHPNGPECKPTCKSASVLLKLTP